MATAIETLPAAELRVKFNERQLWQKAQAGQLRQEIKRNGHPSPPLANEPNCTRSQIIYYFDKADVKVAVVHQYLRPDGTIGLSGMPDPQAMFENGVIYIALKGV